MSLLNTIMSGVMSASKPSGRSGSGGTDPNAAAYRSLLANMVKPGSGYSPEQIAAVVGQAPSSVDTSAYTAIMGMQTPEQKAKREVNNRIYSDFLTILNGGQPVGQQAVAPPPAPTAQGLIVEPTSPGAVPPTVAQPEPASMRPSALPAKLFTKDFVVRKIMKDLTGIDVGGHYLESGEWFKSYGEKIAAGVPVSKAVSDTAIEHTFIPSGASNLKGLSEAERRVIFEGELQTALNDKTIDSMVRGSVPEGTNINKAKLGHILKAFTENDLYIPDHYQPFLDRFRGLEDPDFVSDELKTWAWELTNKMPSELEPSDIANARGAMQTDALVQTHQEAYFRTKGTTKAEWEDEIGKPISSEDRAKHGIGSGIKTYQQLVDEGKRFATDADRKMYQELYQARHRMQSMAELFFGTEEKPENGIFIGIGRAVPARSAARARLTWERWNGTDRGNNVMEFTDYKKYYARTLTKIAGEEGSRLSDQDISGVITVMPDVGTGLTGIPDSEVLARSKYERAIIDMGRLLRLLEDTTTVKPMGQPTAPSAPSDADAAAQSLIDEYTKGK